MNMGEMMKKFLFEDLNIQLKVSRATIIVMGFLFKLMVQSQIILDG